MRFRFSIRTLIITVALLCLLLGISIRFGPHLLWKSTRSEAANGVEAIPTRSLVDVRPVDKLVACNIGPITFEIPTELAETYEIHRGIGGLFLNFYDTKSDRQAVIEIPTTRDEETIIGDIGNPAFSQLSFPRFHKMVVEEQSSDFSWFMTRAQLRDHIFLLEHRAAVLDDTSLLEYLWRTDLEATLTHSGVTTFQWTALDDKLSGTVHFTPSTPEDTDWIRHCCASFKVAGGPFQVGMLGDSEIKSLITITENNVR